ncbi:MAG: ABC transporter ATP-binding protein [Nitrospirae bacterium]|nr:ABC transporter ATP-binding protein [Nitrospirota bacterium]
MVSRSKIIELKNVSRNYLQGSEKIHALKNITLSIDSGEFCILMGPSGCGKSSLINLIGGLDLPDSGEIWLEGKSTEQFTDQNWTLYRRTKIGVIFQFFNLLPTLTVHENISLPLVLNRMFRKEIHRKVAEFLDRLGLTEKSNALPRELSGGEQQRVAIARALVHSPTLLLADEPTGNLDSRMGNEILGLIQSLSKERQMTLLMATHSQEAASFGDRIFSMKDGEIQISK